MAGKNVGASRGVELGNVSGTSGLTDRINVPGKKVQLVKAYAEGRLNVGSNPHASGTEAWRAWQWGNQNRGTAGHKYETAVP